MADTLIARRPSSRTRRIVALAMLFTLIALLPILISTLALVAAAALGCQLSATAGACPFLGADLHAALVAGVATLRWWDWCAWLLTIAILLWLAAFIGGLAHDIRHARRPELAGASSPVLRAYLLIPLTGATVVAFWPIASAIWSTLFASVFDCRVDEGSVHTCVVAGIDYGEALYTAFVMAWMMLIVWPLALIVLVAWIVVAVRVLVKLTGQRPPT